MLGSTRAIMQTAAAFTIIALIVTTSCSAIPKPNDHKDRKYDPDLSEQKHDEGGEHNSDYDHDAFLGRDESKKFDELTPEESRNRLGLLVDKIDADGDGFVTKPELKKWIVDVQRRYIVSDSEKTWNDHKKVDDKVHWSAYKEKTYGFVDEDMKPDDPNYSYRDMIVRDKRRWGKADEDGDTHLDKHEFTNFLHPEEVPHMKDIVVLETLDDIDKDKDGKISLAEYIADLEQSDKNDDDNDDDDKDGDDDGDKEWIESEKEEFKNEYDKDGDGFLNIEEMKKWLVPEETEHPENEADHLMKEADADQDGKLTKGEILDKHDLFAGSQATDFGEILTKHDEF